MYEQFEVIPFLNKTASSPQNGRVHISSEDAKWCLDIVDGRVLFAAHSLQYLIALESILPTLGYGAALPVYRRLTQHLYKQRNIEEHGLEALTWPSTILGVLVQQNTLTLQQAENVLVKLTEDAVESLLGLTSATVTWHPMPTGLWYGTTNGTYISTLLKHLSTRLQAWQPVCDRIYSPYQRPYCENPDELYQPVPQGLLPQPMLKALVRLMQGATIRQLAQSVKQDETRFAKLLYPYIQHRVIKLWPPMPPFDRLPWLPGEQLPAKSVASVPTGNIVTTQAAKYSLVPDTYSVTSTKTLPTNKYNKLGNNTQRPVTNQQKTNNHRPSVTNGVVTKQPDTNKLSTNRASKFSGVAKSSTEAKSRHLIICIDDSQAMLEQIDSYLDSERFELKTIVDPVASVSKICAMKPDLVLMDVSMPSINGNSLCQILKRSYMFKHVPIIMISANASPLNKATAQSSGATDYLEKPFSKEQLMNVINTYLENDIG